MEKKQRKQLVIQMLTAGIITFCLLWLLFYIKKYVPFGVHSLASKDADFQYLDFLAYLKDVFDGKNNIDYYYIDGQTNALERLNLVNKFNEDEDVKVFLISLKAGGSGLNLTSADVVIHFDPWWNPAIEDQATDRAHRIGQQNIVEVIKLIAKDSVEENIIRLQEDKRELINKVISGEEIGSNVIGKLSRDEIIDLFS